jgi:hypothetical protein
LNACAVQDVGGSGKVFSVQRFARFAGSLRFSRNAAFAQTRDFYETAQTRALFFRVPLRCSAASMPAKSTTTAGWVLYQSFSVWLFQIR